MLNRFAFLLLILSFFLVSCQPAQIPAATETAELQTATPQISYPSETPEPTHTALPAVPEIVPKCFTTTEGNPVAFMPDGTKILISERSKVRIFNLETMEEDSFLPTPEAVGPMALSPDGELLAWAREDYTIQLIRIADGKLLNTLEGHTGPAIKLRFSPSGDRLFSVAAMDTWVRIWDRNGKPLDSFEPTWADNLPNEIQGIGISPDGTMLGSVPFDGPAKVWNLAGKKELVNLGVSGGDVTSDIAFSPDGQFVAADLIGQLSLWRTSDWKKTLSGVTSMAFAFSPDSRFLAYSDMDDNFNVNLRSLDGTQETRVFEKEQTFIYDLIFSPDGALLASAGAGIQIWQVETGQLLYVGKATCP
jgi:WD40 repeat protein